MKTNRTQWLALATLAGGLFLSSSAHAAWNFNQANVTGVVGAAGDATVDLSGFAIQNSGYSVTAGVASGGVGGGFNANAKWIANGLSYYNPNGQGMTSGVEVAGTAPDHALDNNGMTESVLMKFSNSTVLSSIGIGWASNGASTDCTTCIVDVSVFRWTGSSAGPTMTTTAGSTSSVGGWELVGNYGMKDDQSNPYNLVNSSAYGSSWWLISAYNSGFATSTITENVRSVGSFDNGNDYFKLFAAAGSNCTSKTPGVCAPGTGTQLGKLPEPASLALTSVALLGMASIRRRGNKSA